MRDELRATIGTAAATRRARCRIAAAVIDPRSPGNATQPTPPQLPPADRASAKPSICAQFATKRQASPRERVDDTVSSHRACAFNLWRAGNKQVGKAASDRRRRQQARYQAQAKAGLTPRRALTVATRRLRQADHRVRPGSAGLSSVSPGRRAGDPQRRGLRPYHCRCLCAWLAPALPPL